MGSSSRKRGSLFSVTLLTKPCRKSIQAGNHTLHFIGALGSPTVTPTLTSTNPRFASEVKFMTSKQTLLTCMLSSQHLLSFSKEAHLTLVLIAPLTDSMDYSTY